MCDKESNDLFSSRWEIFEIIFALIITLTAIINNLASTEGFFIFLAAYIIAGHKIIRTSIKNVLTKEVFDENILMSLATIGAIAIGEYPEAVMVMVLYRIGEYFQDNAIKKSRKSIKKLIDIRPNYANVEYGNKIIRKEPSEVEPNEIIVVRAGERIPLDGVVTEGKAVIDTSTLTGEAIPRVIAAGEIALSGCININGLIRIKVTKEYNESTINRILELVEQANSKKAKTEKFIKKFARYYTPTVVLGALLLATIMPLATGTAFNIWFERALTFLVISCPCALVISIPLGFFAGIGYASRCGILIKGSNYLELLSRVDSVIFDKTGTLTKGCFKINEIVPQNGFTPEELLKLTVLAETHSNHPIAVCIKKTYPTNTNIVKEVEEEAGQGISAVVDGEKILAGNAELMKKYNIPFKAADDSASVIYIAKNGEFVGYITLSDELKPDTEKAI